MWCTYNVREEEKRRRERKIILVRVERKTCLSPNTYVVGASGRTTSISHKSVLESHRSDLLAHRAVEGDHVSEQCGCEDEDKVSISNESGKQRRRKTHVTQSTRRALPELIHRRSCI